MALSEYETKVLTSFKEQGATSSDYKEWLNKSRASESLDNTLEVSQSARQKMFKDTENRLLSGGTKETVEDGIKEDIGEETKIGKIGAGITSLVGMEESEDLDDGNEYNPLGKVGDVLTGTKDVIDDNVGGYISQVPDILGNTFGFLADVITPEAYEGLGDTLREQGLSDKENLQEMLGVDPDSFATKIGEFGAEASSLFLPGGQEKLISKFPNAVVKIGELSNYITKLETKVPKIYNTIKSSIQGVVDMGKYEIISESELTPEGLVTGAIVNPIFNKIVKWVGAGSEIIAEKLQLSGLLNPAKLDAVSKQLATDGISDVSAVGDYLLDKGLTGSKETIAKNLLTDSKASKKLVDDSLSKIKTETFDDSSEKALKIINENIKGKIGLEEDVIKFTNLSEKLQETGLTPSEKNEIKRGLDDFVRIFKDDGEVIAGTTKKGASNVRNSLQKQIENEAKDAGIDNIAALNKNTQISRGLADAILRKDASDQASALYSAFAPSGAGAVIGGISTDGDIFDRLKGAIGGAVIGKVAGSTTVKTNIASLINNLSFFEKIALDNFITSKGAVPLTTEIIEKLTSNQE